MSRTMLRRKLHRESGMTLIELAIAAVVLIVGMLSIMGVLLVAVGNNGRSKIDSSATMLSQAVLEQLRAKLAGGGPGSLTDNANCNGCGSKADDRVLTDVDSFAPNPFGLYGMLGNAWQWTADYWHKSYVGAPGNGSAWLGDDCAKHVLRGGSFDNVPIFVRSAARTAGGGAGYDYSSLAGFRVARTLP